MTSTTYGTHLFKYKSTYVTCKLVPRTWQITILSITSVNTTHSLF